MSWKKEKHHQCNVIHFLLFILLQCKWRYQKEELHNSDLCDCENCGIYLEVYKRLLSSRKHPHKLASRNTETDANTHFKPGVGTGQSPAGYSRQHMFCISELWSVASMSSSGMFVWWVISSFTPGKLYSTAAHKKDDRDLMMQYCTSHHQTLLEANHKMWTFQFIFRGHTEFSPSF